MTNRRQFLSGCPTLALAATVSPCALSAASLLSRDAGAKQFSYEAFSESLGSTFVVQRATEPSVALKLVRARQQANSNLSRPNAPDARHEKFSLLFRGPQNPALGQNSYTFEHCEMGRFEIFIVSVGVKDPSHEYYQAIFNRPAA